MVKCMERQTLLTFLLLLLLTKPNSSIDFTRSSFVFLGCHLLVISLVCSEAVPCVNTFNDNELFLINPIRNIIVHSFTHVPSPHIHLQCPSTLSKEKNKKYIKTLRRSIYLHAYKIFPPVKHSRKT